MMNIKAKRDIAHKTKILNHARESKILLKLVVILGSVEKLFILGNELMHEMARKD
ncbi:hypothetical protein [Providencia alcalifaciens]|uniref:hypothetical protein n=1 Tax=Providencia alcalifaciens TaxID=126385 RepID=UPI001E77BB10|nr:hypothetical protein NVI2019_OGMBKCAO_03878 [Providencia alcalifaciens]CAG9435322.1 hypothetical protein NVI2019_ANGEOOBF_03890 [Providencia alcalifaciens]CAG9435332.1 hypothetical protein NVI2019_KOLGMIGM_03891 [Providencia alcalifaciens]CAG9435333.1 hypothetical protein NVI2019_PLFLNFOB_03889 [Providencia alcalifaciens]CAG9437134.1 hypothetical protein NVI2019_OHEONHNH_03889 [Providencia alcalifaciens]